MKLIPLRLIFSFCLWIALQTSGYSLEKTFYVMHNLNKQTTSDINQYSKSINLIIAQSFRINSKGKVNGDLNPEIIKLCHNNNIKLMAMITNSNYDTDLVHSFLTNTEAQDQALKTILAASLQNHIYGVQFDFEMVALKDRDALTLFYKKAATLFHKNGFRVSFAVAPVLADKDFPSVYYAKLYKIWQGAYDLKALGSAADFITILAYDQHGDSTPPGPIASIPWVEQVLTFILKFIPANKISLGIPTYSGLWYMGENSVTKKLSTRYSVLNFDTANYMMQKFSPQLHWDNTAKINFTFFEYHHLYKFIFFENEKSFKYKMDLAKKYNLQGVSIFRLGIEDPAIWKKI